MATKSIAEDSSENTNIDGDGNITGTETTSLAVNSRRWVSGDSATDPTQLPLAKAVEKVLASMHAVLKDTADYATAAMKTGQAVSFSSSPPSSTSLSGPEQQQQQQQQQSKKERHLKQTKAAEIRVLRNIEALKNPPSVEKFKARRFFSS